VVLNFVKNNIGRIGILIPIITTVFGIIIINISLNKYGIVEYSIFQIQSVFTGSVFLTICYGIFGFFSWLLLKFKKSLLKMVFSVFFSSLLISLVFYHVFVSFDDSHILNLSDFSIIIQSIITILFSLLLFCYLFLKSLKNKDLYYNNGSRSRRLISWLLEKKLVVIIFILVSFSIVLYFNDEVFRDLFDFFFIFSLLLLVGIWTLNKNDSYEKKRHVNEEKTWNDVNVGIIFILVYIVLGTYLYSLNVYPYLPKNFGGGKPEYVEVTYLDNHQIKGEVIHSNSNLIFINVKNKIQVIEWNKVQELKTRISR